MKYQEALICWTPNVEHVSDLHGTRGQVKVGPLGQRWSDAFAYSGGAAWTHIQQSKNKAERDMMLFIEFHTIVVRDKIPFDVVHEAFLAIDEYRQRISPDIEGAED